MSNLYRGIGRRALICIAVFGLASACRTTDKQTSAPDGARNLAAISIADMPVPPDSASVSERAPWLGAAAVIWDAPSGHRFHVSYLSLSLSEMVRFCSGQSARPASKASLSQALQTGLYQFLPQIQRRASTELLIWTSHSEKDFPEITALYSIGRRTFRSSKKNEAFALAACERLSP